MKKILSILLAGLVCGLLSVTCGESPFEKPGGGPDTAQANPDGSSGSPDALDLPDQEDSGYAPDDGGLADTGRDAENDSGSEDSGHPDSGSGTDTGLPDDSGTFPDAGVKDGGVPDSGQVPDCAAISGHAGWELCSSSKAHCSAVFTDKAGCGAVCAAVGMNCEQSYENIDGQCAADLSRPALGCAETGHGSDYCLCSTNPPADGGTPDSGMAEDCKKYPFKAETLYSERAGFGRNVTGGNPSNVYRVTSKNDSGAGTLRNALESSEDYWIVFDVEGEFVFDFASRVRVKSNKTVDGRGRTVKIRDAQFAIDPGVKNVIFSDVEAYFEDPQDGVGDLFGLRGHGGSAPGDYDTRGFWFHHLNLHHAGDGLIDVRGATEITISWVHFHDHTKVMLHTMDTDGNASPGTHITYHHNWLDTVTRRSPHFAYGKADFFNNWQYHWYEYGAASIDDAQFLSEANIYEAREGWFCIPACPDPSPHGGGNDFLVSKKGLVNDWAVDKTVGFTKSVGDLLLNDAAVTVYKPENVFSRTNYYTAVVEPADDALKNRIRAGAGPRVGYCR